MSEKEVTREITEPEELQAEEEKCATAADSQLNIAPAEQSSESFEIPAEIFQKLQENEADLKKWKKRIEEKLTRIESLRQKEAETEKLVVEISILEENEKTLSEKKIRLAADIANLHSFIMENQQELRNLYEEKFEVYYRVYDAEHDRKNQLALLTKEIYIVQTTLDTLNERNTFLLDQNSHTAAMLTQVKSDRDKLRRKTLQLMEAVQNLKNENEEVEYQIMKNEPEIKKLNRIIADKQYQTDDLIKGREIRRQIIQALKDQPSLLQKKKILADSEETMNPAAEPPPNSGSWFPSTKCLLVGLGVAVGGLLIYSAFRAT